jgi:hypothetical protein
MRCATSRILLLTLAAVLPLSAKVIFPLTVATGAGVCTLGSGPATDIPISFTLKTDGDSEQVTGLPEQNSFLRSSAPIQVTVSPIGATINVSADPTKLAYGSNKAFVGFFVGSASTFSNFVVINVNCFPPPSVILAQDSVNVQAPAGSGAVTVSLPSEITGNPSISYGSSYNLSLTPDTTGSPTSWITSASMPGFAPGSGSIAQNGTADLMVTLNVAGLPVRPLPYLGLLRISDTTQSHGEADLTIWLTVTGSATGNALLPHIAVNADYTTSFYVVNTGTSNSNFRLDFFDDAGNPLSIPVAGQGQVNHVSGTLAGGASAYFEAGDSSTPYVGGSALITADPYIGAQAMFRHRVQDGTGTHYYEAAVAATAGSNEFQIPFDATTFAPTGEQTYTGIAVGNLDSSTSGIVTCTARDSGGNTITNAIPGFGLAPKAHWAGYNFPLLAGKRGTIDCVGTTTIGAIALHTFIGGANSSLPVFLK